MALQYFFHFGVFFWLLRSGEASKKIEVFSTCFLIGVKERKNEKPAFTERRIEALSDPPPQKNVIIQMTLMR